MSTQPPTRIANIVEGQPLKIFIVAGEHSGDALGAKLMPALRAQHDADIAFVGVGGPLMEAEGLTSLFPLEDVAVMGLGAIVKALPRLVRRVYQVVDAGRAFQPDIILIIDSPEFTHPIAKRLRKAFPNTPIIDYVSPSVWAWRSGRARKMVPYVDHILALLPFEPAAHQRLGGPACTYIGHPLIEKRAWIESLDPDLLKVRLSLSDDRPVLVVLPGSRGSEISQLMVPFGATLQKLMDMGVRPHVIVPTVSGRHDLVAAGVREWPITPHLVQGEDDKFRAFRLADAALAASGTVTLELAVSGTPMVVAYRVERLMTFLRYVLDVPSVVLANLVLDELAFPEFLQEDCTPEKLAPAVADLLQDTSALHAQRAALSRVPDVMATQAQNPSVTAAEVILSHVSRRDRS